MNWLCLMPVLPAWPATRTFSLIALIESPCHLRYCGRSEWDVACMKCDACVLLIPCAIHCLSDRVRVAWDCFQHISACVSKQVHSLPCSMLQTTPTTTLLCCACLLCYAVLPAHTQAVGADSTFSMDNGSVDEVMAQLSAERAAGLSDEPQLRPEAANLSSSTSATVLPQAQAVVADGLALADIAAAADTPPQQYMQSLVESPAAADAAAALSDDTLSAFDHMTLPPSAGAADAAATWPTMPAQQKQDAQVVDTQHPSLADCVAAVEEPLTASADAVEEDEEPDDVMAAFDHTALDSAAAAAVASGNQSPSLADIALAVEPSVLPASVTEGSLGEDEEPDVVLAAFDHMAPEPTAAASAVAVPAAAEEAASGYDQTFLDPVQPSAFGASVGSGSMDLADSEAEPVAPAPQAPKVAVTAGAGAAVKQQRKQGGSQGDVGAIMQRWWASVLMMFDEWQKNLSGRK